VVTLAGDEPAGAVERVAQLWEAVGARVRRMTPAAHDRVMARTSHLTHLVAATLSAAVGRAADVPELHAFCGPGFRDTTRVAEGGPEIWVDILRSNRADVATEMKAFGELFQQLAEWVEAGEFDRVRAFLEESRERRRALLRGRESTERRGEP
jgi:prephenate dehydrogenase